MNLSSLIHRSSGLCENVINKLSTDRCFSGNSKPGPYALESDAITTDPQRDKIIVIVCVNSIYILMEVIKAIQN